MIISPDCTWTSGLKFSSCHSDSELLSSHPGGGSGIGRAVCQRFASEGASVVVADISRESANETLGILPGDLRGQGHMAAVVDVSSKQSVKELVTSIQVCFSIKVIIRNIFREIHTFGVFSFCVLSLCRLVTFSLPQCVWTQQASPRTTSCCTWRRISSITQSN